MDAIVLDALERVFIPLVTLAGGWFAHLFRTKQKKEKDILDNVQQILKIQKTYIEEQQGVIIESKNVIKRLEAKLDKKNKSIRQANRCRFTNEGEGCPVLVQEEHFDDLDCDKCEYKNNDTCRN